MKKKDLSYTQIIIEYMFQFDDPTWIILCEISSSCFNIKNDRKSKICIFDS